MAGVGRDTAESVCALFRLDAREDLFSTVLTSGHSVWSPAVSSRRSQVTARAGKCALYSEAAPAADALGEPELEPLQLGDPLVDPRRPVGCANSIAL
jgi:hypothetical protein